jgi:hypothetical protein
MKKLVLMLVMMALCAGFLAAQDEKNDEKDEVKSLFGGSGKLKSTCYGAANIKFTNINSEFAVLVGGRGVWTINKSFGIGLAGFGLVTQHKFDYKTNALEQINSSIFMGYGGLFLEYIIQPREYIHFSANTILGFGGSGLSNIGDSLFMNDNFMNNSPWKAHFIVEPSLAVEFNITKFFRVTFEGGYRLVTDINKSRLFENTIDLKDRKIGLSGFTGGMTLQFGIF